MIKYLVEKVSDCPECWGSGCEKCDNGKITEKVDLLEALIGLKDEIKDIATERLF